MLVVDEGLLGGEDDAAHGKAGQDVDAVRVVGEAGIRQVLGVGVVPLIDHADVGICQLVGVGLAEALAAGVEVVELRDVRGVVAAERGNSVRGAETGESAGDGGHGF